MGTAAPGCRIERSSTALLPSSNCELCSVEQPRAACPHVVAGSVKLRHPVITTVGSQPGRRYNSSKSARGVV